MGDGKILAVELPGKRSKGGGALRVSGQELGLSGRSGSSLHRRELGAGLLGVAWRAGRGAGKRLEREGGFCGPPGFGFDTLLRSRLDGGIPLTRLLRVEEGHPEQESGGEEEGAQFGRGDQLHGRARTGLVFTDS